MNNSAAQANRTTLPAGTWNLDTAGTTVAVSVKKLGFITVNGDLTVTSGAIEINEANQVTSVEVIADAKSYASGNDKRDEHVLGPDFLDTDNHATIVVRANAVTPAGSGYSAKGTVTIKGKSTPITIAISDVKVTGSTAAFSASATVNRVDAGVDKMPGFVIGKDLVVSVAARASQA